MFSKPLLAKELRQLRWKLVIGLLLLSLIGVSYPFVHNTLVSFLQGGLPENLPFGISREILPSLNNYTIAVYSNWNAKNLPQIGVLFAVLLGMSLLANEYELDTISFLLATGLSRRTIFWTKVAAGLIALLVMVAVPSLALLPATRLAGHQFEHLRWLWGSLVTVSGLVLFYAISVWWSVRLRDGLKAGLLTGVIAIVLMLLPVVPGLAVLSPFARMAGYPYFIGTAGFPWLTLAGLLLLAGLILWTAYCHFQHRDI